MKKEWIVNRQGKDFILYQGILSLAHEQGLLSITTDLVQIPSEANNRVAICKATVTLDRDGKVYQFEGYGDAAPNNVAPAMQNCLIRLAETRAKARAMRDAVNIGMASLEEVDGEEDVPDRGYETSRRQTRVAATPQATNSGPLPINDSGVQCPVCKAPNLKPHLKTCTATA